MRRPVVANVAAAVAWGDWQPPQVVELPDDVDSGGFRRALRKGAFRRREPGSGVIGVRVLDTVGTYAPLTPPVRR
jgi:hypothetical protein